MENGQGDGGGAVTGSRRRHSAPEVRTDSGNLRDFLRVKEDDLSRHNSLAGLTLGAVLTGDKSPGTTQPPPLTQSQSNRTLLDVIRDDPTVTKESKKSWKAFKDKLRLRRAGAGAGASWTSTVPIPASDVPIQPSANRMMSRRESVRFPTMEESGQNSESNRPQLNSIQSSRSMLLRRNTSRVPERQASRLIPSDVNISAPDDLDVDVEEDDEDDEETEESPDAEGGGGEQPQVRMSLMALLAETDKEMGIAVGGYLDDDDEDEDEDEVESGGGGAGGGGGDGGEGGEYNNCCVCMVRHKGAAFIPCGHTFCRLCSRELWVQRGNCPLCNNFILEILDIF